MMPDQKTTRPLLLARIKRAEQVLAELQETAELLAQEPLPDRWVRERKAANRAEVEAWQEHLAAAQTLLAVADQAWESEARTREQLGNLVDRLGGKPPSNA